MLGAYRGRGRPDIRYAGRMTDGAIPVIEAPAPGEAPTLAQCYGLLVTVLEEINLMRRRVDELEAEFGPLARKYGRVINAASALPGVGMGRKRG
jgi:hypothetical protein